MVAMPAVKIGTIGYVLEFIRNPTKIRTGYVPDVLSENEIIVH